MQVIKELLQNPNPLTNTDMKKLFWMTLLVAAAFSCHDDKESKPNVVGSWLLTASVYSNCDNSDDNGSDLDEDGCTDGNCSIVTFESNGNFTYTNKEFDTSDDVQTGTYTQSGSKITL